MEPLSSLFPYPLYLEPVEYISTRRTFAPICAFSYPQPPLVKFSRVDPIEVTATVLQRHASNSSAVRGTQLVVNFTKFFSHTSPLRVGRAVALTKFSLPPPPIRETCFLAKTEPSLLRVPSRMPPPLPPPLGDRIVVIPFPSPAECPFTITTPFPSPSRCALQLDLSAR